MSNIQMLSMINKFPIGDIAINREQLLAKAEIISFLARYQDEFLSIENADEREEIVKAFLSEVLELNEQEMIPSLEQAEKILNLSNGFIQDFNSIQYIKENNPVFNEAYSMISNNLGLVHEEITR